MVQKNKVRQGKSGVSPARFAECCLCTAWSPVRFDKGFDRLPEGSGVEDSGSAIPGLCGRIKRRVGLLAAYILVVKTL